MHKIKIGFSRSTKKFAIFGWAIQLFQRTSYSHVYIRDYSKWLDMEGVYQASGSLVNYMHIDNFLDHSEIVREFELEVSSEARKAIIQRCHYLCGRPYGMKQIMAILLAKLGIRSKHLRDGENAYICSELVVDALDKANIINKLEWGKSVDLVTPKDIYEKLNNNK